MMPVITASATGEDGESIISISSRLYGHRVLRALCRRFARNAGVPYWVGSYEHGHVVIGTKNPPNNGHWAFMRGGAR